MGDEESILPEEDEDKIMSSLNDVISGMTEEETKITEAISDFQDTGTEVLGNYMDLQKFSEMEDEKSERVMNSIKQGITWIDTFRLTMEMDRAEYTDYTDLITEIIEDGIKNESEDTVTAIYHRSSYKELTKLFSGFQEFFIYSNPSKEESVIELRDSIKSVVEGLYKPNLKFIRMLLEPASGKGRIGGNQTVGGLMSELEDDSHDFSEILLWKALEVKNSTSHPDTDFHEERIEFLNPEDLTGKGVDKNQPYLTKEDLKEIRGEVIQVSTSLMISHKEIYSSKLYDEENWYSQEEIGFLLATLNNMDLDMFQEEQE
ncbi:MAG: hypothetical protein ABEJ95_07880 [Candidatus Nanohalobium sp.]